jgi:hypothetical protein
MTMRLWRLDIRCIESLHEDVWKGDLRWHERQRKDRLGIDRKTLRLWNRTTRMLG